MKIRISTPYGNRYTVDDKWRIGKQGVEPSDQWVVSGVGKLIAFGQVRRLPKEFLLTLAKNHGETYKNGNPRFTIFDVDHGTTRMWGNTKYHGIKHVEIIEE